MANLSKKKSLLLRTINGDSKTSNSTDFSSSYPDSSTGGRLDSTASWRYEIGLVSTFICVVAFSLTDLVTTSIALKQGLREGNVLLLSIAHGLNLSFIQTITASKLGFILGAGVLMFLGIRSRANNTRKLMLSSMIIFAVLLFLVSMNNFILIS